MLQGTEACYMIYQDIITPELSHGVLVYTDFDLIETRFL